MKIGLEVHIALPTRSKLFCSCSADGDEPNTSVCPICMGFPGSKPLLNRSAVKYARDIANALHCRLGGDISFVRKVYFYPDLPKCYQITQTEHSIGSEGYLTITGKKVGIRRIQLEEDPAKLVREGALTLIDFNRSGTPLVEVVTEPDIIDEHELWGFLRTLRSILYYLNIDINKEIKVDLNISLAEHRVEVKNITGIKNILEAAKYEIKRQKQVLAEGKKIIGETRGYNETRRNTVSMREKETDEEYGYIFEPDLTIFNVDGIKTAEPTYITEIANEMAAKYKSNARTIMELTMFNRRSLELMDKFRQKHPMQHIINAIQRMEKYEIHLDDEGFVRLLGLIAKDVIINQEVLQKVSKGHIDVSYEKLTEKEMEKAIWEFVNSKKGILEECRTNKKAINLLIGEISKRYGLHPKDVAKAVNSFLIEQKII